VTEATIEFACPLCQRVTRVPAAFAGKQGKCPGCRQVIEVPDPNAPPEPEPTPEQVEAAGAATTVEPIGTPVDLGPAPLRIAPSGRVASTDEIISADAPGAQAHDPRPAPASALAPGHRACKQCGQAIRSAAVKCRHCGHIDDKPCPACGEQIKATAKKCRFCGEFLDEAMRLRRRQGDMDYVLASHGARLGAYLLDSVVLNAPAYVLWILAAAWADRSSTQVMSQVAALSGLAWWVCLAVIQWIRIANSGQTIAKKWLGIQIVRTDGSPVDFVHGVILRNWITGVIVYFCCMFYLIGMLFHFVDSVMIFAEDRRTLHDHFASTRVIEVGSDRRRT
jgi:uncharacterized RDD family membrane protein YckC